MNDNKLVILIDENGKLNSDWREVVYAADLDALIELDLVATLGQYARNIENETVMRLKQDCRKKGGLNIIDLMYIINSDCVLDSLCQMCLNPEEVCSTIGVTLDELLDLANWNKKYIKGTNIFRNGDTFTNPHNGKKWKFVIYMDDSGHYYEIQ